LVNLDSAVLLELEAALLQEFSRWNHADSHDDEVGGKSLSVDNNTSSQRWVALRWYDLLDLCPQVKLDALRLVIL
jgi:hypothetical protein